jgi:hypothetical protein
MISALFAIAMIFIADRSVRYFGDNTLMHPNTSIARVETREHKRFAMKEAIKSLRETATEVKYATEMKDSLSTIRLMPAIESSFAGLPLQSNPIDDANRIRRCNNHIKHIKQTHPIPALYNQPYSRETDRLLCYSPSTTLEPSNQSNRRSIVDGSYAARNEFGLATNEAHECERGPSIRNDRDLSSSVVSFARPQQYLLGNNLLSALTATSVSEGDVCSSSIGVRLRHDVTADRELLLYPLRISVDTQLQLQSPREMCSRL